MLSEPVLDALHVLILVLGVTTLIQLSPNVFQLEETSSALLLTSSMLDAVPNVKALLVVPVEENVNVMTPAIATLLTGELTAHATNALLTSMASFALETETVTATVEPANANLDGEDLPVIAELVKEAPHVWEMVFATVMEPVLATLDGQTPTQSKRSAIVQLSAQTAVLETELASVEFAIANLVLICFPIALAKTATWSAETTKFATAKDNANVTLDSLVPTAIPQLTVLLLETALTALPTLTADGVTK